MYHSTLGLRVIKKKKKKKKMVRTTAPTPAFLKPKPLT